MDDYTLTVGAGISLYACMTCGHYVHADTASSALSLMRCDCCGSSGSSLMKRIQSAEDIRQLHAWRDFQMLVEGLAEGWRGPMTPHIA